MNSKVKGCVQLWKPGKKYGSPVTGIHFEVEKDLEVIEDGIVDVIRFINDDDRSLPLFDRKTGYLFLDDPEIIRFCNCSEPR